MLKNSGGAAALLTTLLCSLASLATAKETPKAPAGPPVATFTAGSAASRAAARRVAISRVVISFQTSVGDTVSTAAHTADYARYGLAAAGFEVVPESELLASASYQALLKEAGYSNPSRHFNMDGDVLLAAPATLKPCMAYALEQGDFFENGRRRSYIPGWIRDIPVSGGGGGAAPMVVPGSRSPAVPGRLPISRRRWHRNSTPQS